MRNGADCPAIDEYRQDLHDEAVATGRQTAEAEEPRGEALRERGKDEGEDEEEGEAPDVQQECPADVRQLGHLRRGLGGPVGAEATGGGGAARGAPSGSGVQRRRRSRISSRIASAAAPPKTAAAGGPSLVCASV